MYVSQAEVGAIALGQSDKTLQLTAMLLSFIDTTKELGVHHEFKPATEVLEERT